MEAAKVYKLSPREMEVLEQALKGYSAPRIAENLFMSKGTVNVRRDPSDRPSGKRPCILTQRISALTHAYNRSHPDLALESHQLGWNIIGSKGTERPEVLGV